MESSPKKSSRKRSKTTDQGTDAPAGTAPVSSDSEKEINVAAAAAAAPASHEEGAAAAAATSPTTDRKKKKSSSKKKEKTSAAAAAAATTTTTTTTTAAAAPAAVLDDTEEKVVIAAAPATEPTPPLAIPPMSAATAQSPPRKASKEKDNIESLVSPRVFTRKRSDTVLSDFEEVLDVADEEGLTDDQVYITKVMRGIRKGAMYGETLGKLQRDEKEFEMMREEDREPMGVLGFIRRDYKDKVTFKFTSPTPAGSRIPLMKKDKVVIMTDYAPKIFNNLRKKCNVPTEDYLRAWTFPKDNLPSPNLGAGRSGSLFVSSSDSRFVFKTIPEFEVETLLEILPSLHQHFVDHPESRIIRFLGLHHFYDTITKEETHCIVMNNLLLHPSYGIDEKWDLKGRIPKPGKQGRFADKVDRSKKVLKDNDLLDRRFHLSEEARDQLLRTLNADVEFLKEHNCMDYSLLVGVHFLSDVENAVEVAHESAEQKAKEEKKAKKSKKSKRKSKKNADEREVEAEEDQQQEQTISTQQNESQQPLLLEGVMGPIHSDPAFVKEIYFVGIIDPLSRYKLRKKVAHFLKEFFWDADTLSTVPADYYADRYSRYLAEIFVHRQPGEVVAQTPALAPAPAAVAPAPVVHVPAAELTKEEKVLVQEEVKPEAAPPASEEKEKKGTLKRNKKNKKDKLDDKEEVVVVATPAPSPVVVTAVPVPVPADPVILVKDDSEEPVTAAAIVVDPTAAAVVGREVEIKISDEPATPSPIVASKEPKRDGTLKKKKKTKASKTTSEVNGNVVVVVGDESVNTTTPSSSSLPTTTTPTATTSNGVAAAPGVEVEIKIEGPSTPSKKEKKSKRDGTLKREKKSKTKEQL